MGRYILAGLNEFVWTTESIVFLYAAMVFALVGDDNDPNITLVDIRTPK